MSQSSSRSRKFAPLAVLAAAALVLATPVAANAAIAGALPANSTLTPDLISATVTTVAANGTTVSFCFNKAIGSTPVPARFSIRTYRNQSTAGTAASATGQCASVRFATVADPTTYTTVGAADAAVVNSTTGTESEADSTALIGSATNNGTRGRSTAPDLVGVSASGSKVSYTFDEALATTPLATEFSIQDVNNLSGPPSALVAVLSTDRKTVTVEFPTALVVAEAVRATYEGTSVVSQATNDPAPISAAALPGSNGATTVPDPLQAILQDGGTTSITPGAGTIDVVFDEPAVSGASGSYMVLLSDASMLPATAAQLNANTIRLTVATLPVVGEYVVGVEVDDLAVVGGNSIATVPAGGNTGAFATGFTTGPDASAMTFDGPSNSATITLDQRYASAVAANFKRVDNTGTVEAGTPATLSFSATAAPGPTTIVATFPSLAGTRALQILAGGVSTSLNAGVTQRDSNVNQILAPSASTAG